MCVCVCVCVCVYVCGVCVYVIIYIQHVCVCVCACVHSPTHVCKHTHICAASRPVIREMHITLKTVLRAIQIPLCQVIDIGAV